MEQEEKEVKDSNGTSSVNPHQVAICMQWGRRTHSVSCRNKTDENYMTLADWRAYYVQVTIVCLMLLPSALGYCGYMTNGKSNFRLPKFILAREAKFSKCSLILFQFQ